MKVEVKKLLTDISKMKSVEIEISEKERDSIHETEIRGNECYTSKYSKCYWECRPASYEQNSKAPNHER